MRHIQFIILSLASLLLAGCRSEDPFKHVVFADSPDMFNFVMPVGRSAPSINEDVTYNIVFDDVKRNATLTINNLQLPGEDLPVMAAFEDVIWTYEPGSHEKRRIIETDLMQSNPALGAAITLTDVTIIYSESNEMNPDLSAGFYASYLLNDQYRIMAYPYRIYADGTTTVAAQGAEAAGERRIYYDTKYVVDFQPTTMTATIFVEGLEIEGQLLDFEINNLKLGLTADGYALSRSAGTSVRIPDGGTEVTVNDVAATAVLREDLVLNMEIKVGGAVYAVEGILSPDLNQLLKK